MERHVCEIQAFLPHAYAVLLHLYKSVLTEAHEVLIIYFIYLFKYMVW